MLGKEGRRVNEWSVENLSEQATKRNKDNKNTSHRGATAAKLVVWSG